MNNLPHTPVSKLSLLTLAALAALSGAGLPQAHAQTQVQTPAQGPAPAPRPIIAIGLIEGVISLRKVGNESLLTPVRNNDGFDEALRGIQDDFNTSASGTQSKAGSAAARAAFYIKGAISGQTLLTAAYDSDKETRARLLRDIRPDELYPVFGDASSKAHDAQSSQKFYVRLDHGKNYLLYGDFNTGSSFNAVTGTGSVASLRQRDLGQYSRSITGVRGQLHGPASFLNAFVAHDTLKQQIEEVQGNGGSFYNLSRADALDNSEKIEILVRDRANAGRILSATPLQRFVDYTFEPFSGRIITKAPISSTDAQGNPQTLRMTYEVDGGGDKYVVAGVDGQATIAPGVEIGASFVQDKNPQSPLAGASQLKDLSSVNLGVQLAPNVRLVAEAAQSNNLRTQSAAGVTTTQAVKGQAVRAELAFGSTGSMGSAAQPAGSAGPAPVGSYAGSAFFVQADQDFNNPNASVSQGRTEAGIKLRAQVAAPLALQAEWLSTQSKTATAATTTKADRQTAYLGADYALNADVSLQAGIRKSEDNGAGLLNPVQSASPSLYGSGGIFNPGHAGGSTSVFGSSAGKALDTTTAVLGLRARLSPQVSAGLEAESNLSGDRAHRTAAHVSYQIAERTKLHARYETQTALGSFADRENKADAFVLGVSNGYAGQALGSGMSGEVFSEYRLRDAIGGRESQMANGLRNTLDLNAHWRAVAAAEHIKILAGGSTPTLALSTGLEYRGPGSWKGSGRLEWRKASGASGSTGLLSTLSVAHQLSSDWTLLARNYFASTDAAATPGSQKQDRFTLGAAYRPAQSNRFDLLTKLEYKQERNTEFAQATSHEDRQATVASLHANWHPVSTWWLSARAAAKRVTEAFPALGSSGAVLTSRDSFSAQLISARVMHDLTPKVDLGAAASIMQGQGSRQSAYGLEMGYSLQRNVWLSAGYNFAGFTDRDLTGNEYTAKGPYIRLRAKFDESMLGLK